MKHPWTSEGKFKKLFTSYADILQLHVHLTVTGLGIIAHFGVCELDLV